MDYIAIAPGVRRAPVQLVIMCLLEVALALAAAWVAITRVPASVVMDHRELIVAIAGGSLPIALIACPVIAFVAFKRRADGVIWPALWAPGVWALLILAGA